MTLDKRLIKINLEIRLITSTQSIPNYKMSDFFYTKFDRSSYLEICAKYHFFFRGLVYKVL